MRFRFILALAAVALLGTQICLAGSIKGKVTPGKSSVVWVEAAPGAAPAGVDKHVVMDQKGLLFVPHVLVVQKGTTVDFLNSDKVQHNVFWPSISGNKKKSHNMGTWPQGQKKSFKFDEAGIVPLLCNVHPEMSGYIVVVPTPHFAETAANGSYTIANVPDGQYTVSAWHEGKKVSSKKITVSGNTTADFTLQ